MAASGSAVIRFDNTTTWRLEQSMPAPGPYQRFAGVAGNTQVQNVYQPGQTVVTSLTVTLSVSSSVPLTTSAAGVSFTGTGWSVQSVGVSGGSVVYVFVWAGSLISSASTPQLQFEITSSGPSIDSASVPTFSIAWQASSPQAQAGNFGTSSA